MMRRVTEKTQTGSLSQLDALKANDEKAMKHFYHQNYPKVERYVLDNKGTTEEAKDVFQEAFIAVWRNIQLDRFQQEHAASLDAYLFQVAKYKWIDQLRLLKRMPLVAITNEENDPEQMAELPGALQLQIDQIKLRLKELGAPCKEVLERFYYRKESLGTIAEAMNWTGATAKNNKYRCLQRLRELIKNNMPSHG
jgi:RNA polymerase sigma factor (sigma-70 family)